ncbi:hypothetical protein OHA72_16735 [Dactylosporangium sp. NBC_01737]|uniref:hypothetical protein n=1 Tax=Dactylosporangium sp. NBC_01737 TaxID=2975959 RepID=UPI002E104E4D|nr:hypothetical protein OHA72_16735 [Dactylosporangium sp. NBC_01737]
MSSHDAYAEPERGRTLTVVLLALLILTVIGALFGFVLGRRDIDDPKSNAGNGQSPRPAVSVTSQGAPTPAADPCPNFIEAAVKRRDAKAATPLTLQLFIRTDKREAWVCLEADGQGLWYQGHDKRKSFYNGGAGETPVEGENGLLLGGGSVSASGTDKFIASNGGTKYALSRDKLVVTGDQNFTEDVKESLPKK